MSTIANLNVKIGADIRDLDKSLGTMESKTSKALGNIAKVAAAATAAIAAAAFALGTKSMQEFGKFETGMNEVLTLLPDLSDDAFSDMQSQVKDFAKQFGVLPEKVIPALYQAISAGVPADNVFAFLETAQKAAKGGVTGLETAVDGMSSVVNAYGAEEIDAAKASDLMFTAVKKGKTTFDELSSSLFQVIPTAASLDLEFENITAALASMTAQGVPTSVATTQLRQMLVELSKEGSGASEMFQELSGKTFKDFISEGNNLADVLTVMEQGAANENKSMADMFGSVEAGNAALALSGKNMEGFASNLLEMADATGATDTAFETMDRGVATTMEKIKASVNVAMISVGEELAPTFEKFASWIQDNMPAIEEFVVSAFEAVVEIIDSMVNAVKGMIDWYNEYKAILDPLAVGILAGATAFGIYTVAMWLATTASAAFGVVMAFVTSPIGLVVLAIAALAAIVYLVIKNWDKIKEFFLKLWDKVKEIFFSVWEWIKKMFMKYTPYGLIITHWDKIKEFFIGLWDKVKSIFSSTWEWIKEMFFKYTPHGLIIKNWDKIKDFFVGLWSKVKEIFLKAWDNIKAVFSGVGNWFGDIFTGAFDKIKGAFSGIKNFFSDLWSRIKGIFSDIGSAIGDVIGSKFKGVINGILGFAEKTINGFIRNINSAISIINKIPLVNIPKISELNIPKLETGTNFVPKDMIAMLHKGEAVVPKKYNDNGNANIEELLNRLERILLSQKQPQLVMDSRLVGQILTPYVDDELYRKQKRENK